jgi:putative endonuclease
MKTGYVYILSNYARTTLYIGVTNNITRRIVQHRLGIGSQFTSNYKLNYLLYFEIYSDIKKAVRREKQLKNWRKEWKWNLIKNENKNLIDLVQDWIDPETSSR